jgi:hypothetical protein
MSNLGKDMVANGRLTFETGLAVTVGTPWFASIAVAALVLAACTMVRPALAADSPLGESDRASIKTPLRVVDPEGKPLLELRGPSEKEAGLGWLELLELIAKLVLSWPVLFFAFLFWFVRKHGTLLGERIQRGHFTIKWGPGEITLHELSESLDKELDPMRNEIEDIKRALASLQKSAPESDQARKPPVAEQPLDERRADEAQRRMKEALATGKAAWRSFERLAVIGGVSESEVDDILRPDPEVEFSIGKSGRRIARLKSRRDT